MKYRNLGTTGLSVSELSLGTMQFSSLDENECFAIMDVAFDRGINLFDTADVYDSSEITIGRWIKKRKNRDRLLISTKCGFPYSRHPLEIGASPRHIIRSVEESLVRLKTDFLDLFHIHIEDPHTHEHVILLSLERLVQQGKILHYAASNYSCYRLTRSLISAQKLGAQGYCGLQAQYSLVERSLEREHFSALSDFGLSLLAWSPLAKGFLSGRFVRGETSKLGRTKLSTYKRFDRERNWTVLELLRNTARELDTMPAAVALSWILERPVVATVIFGATKTEHVIQNSTASHVEIPKDIRDLLDSTFSLGYPYEGIANFQMNRRASPGERS